jgi:hypothetical protein
LQQPSTTWCMKPKPSQSQMSSLLERLPPELFSQICSTIHRFQEYNRQCHTAFLNLSLVSRKCRSYSTPYIFDRLFLKETCLGDSATSLAYCIFTLGRLNLLSTVRDINVVVPVSSGRCEWEYERESVVQSLQKFPNLTRLYIRTGEVLTEELVDEVQQILMLRCCLGHGGKLLDRYWWWYSMKGQDEARVFQDEKLVSTPRCRMVKLFGRSKRRLPLISSYPISNSSRFTYLFLLG